MATVTDVTDVPLELPLEFPAPRPRPRCWYCGTAEAIFEHDHQLPVSRGGSNGANLVRACAPCNDLKGPLQLEEYRQGLAERLGIDTASLVFAGEATAQRPATPMMDAVRSLEADRCVVRLAPTAKLQLEQALRFLRSVLSPTLTQRDLATAAVVEHLDRLRRQYLDDDDATSWPNPAPGLFGDDDEEVPLVTGRRELCRTPKVRQSVEKTSIGGAALDWARAAVQYRRAHGEPDVRLLHVINEAVLRALEADAARSPDFPTLSQALDARYSSGDGASGH